VKKINSHITKKVADKLDEIFRNDRKSFEEKWESLGLFVKYGMMTDDKFSEKAEKFFIMEDTEGKFQTIEEYRNATSAIQKNKEGKHVILYTTQPVQQDAFIQQAVGRGYKVVKMETLVDAAFINNIEMKWSDVQFTRVDSDIADNLIDKSESSDSVLSKDESEKLKALFDKPQEGLHINVEVKGLPADAPPVTATRPEMMRRMKDMASVGGGMASWYASMPDEVNLTINGNHSIFRNILAESDAQRQEKLVQNLADLALLAQGLLSGSRLTGFINRSVKMMEDA
jgi:molecular chaperone HtpG